MSFLEFQDEMFTNTVNDDACLVVTSRGMGLEQLTVRLMRTYSDSNNLVIVIGAEPDEETYFLNILFDQHELPIGKVPQRITSESTNAKKRREIYTSGGVLFVTTRILVVDLLLERVPVDLITGIIVYKAHRITSDCLMCFIMRLYRLKNQTGFVKALSQNPQSFINGFGKLDKTMRCLFVTSLHLWPRFHASIKSSLGPPRMQPNIIEIRLKLSENMTKIQFAITDLIGLCLKELAKTNSAFLYDADELTVDNAISRGFDHFIQNRFDSIWHQLSSRAKRLINDIQWLRSLLQHLTQSDAVAFYNQTRSAQNSIRVGVDVSDWIFWKPAEILFSLAKQRLYPGGATQPNFESETNQKWKGFQDIIDEIDQETQDIDGTVDVVIIVAHDGVSRLLKAILEKGAVNILRERFERFTALVTGGKLRTEEDDNEGDSDRGETEKRPVIRQRARQARNAAAEQKLPDDTITLTQVFRKMANKNENEESSGEADTAPIDPTPVRGVHQLKLHYFSLREKYIALEVLLTKLRPRHILMYDIDLQALRIIELYQAIHWHPEQCTVYFFIFDKSFEEQQYLTTIRREREAFEKLIKEKSTMVIPSGRDGRSEGHPDLIRGSEKASETTESSVNTRKAGGQLVDRASIIQQKILVDMREFRCELPSIIHKRGIEIDPIQLEIGDYILAPDTCVERKSINDLIQSLQSGRLYNQARAMTRHFKRSILLIEFDESKSFHFKGRYWGVGGENFRSNERRFDLIDRLILLTVHQPNLRLVWSPSTHFTAEVFEYLKAEREQPDAEKILAMTNQELPPDNYEEKYDMQAKEFLMKLPGVNSYNIFPLMNSIDCLADLADISIEEFTEILGNSQSAELIFKTLHSSMNKLVNDAIQVEQESKKSRLFSATKKRKQLG